MLKQPRILTIDIMRGLTLFLMLFVNDLYVDGVPDWLCHRPADYDGIGLADWVFPGFLFMVGMAVPFAVQSRIRRGDSNGKIIYHIIIRTISLLLIGVLMINVGRVNPELTGVSSNLWAILVYICIFLIWNMYGKLKPMYVFVLKGVGVIGLVAMAAVFKAGTPDKIEWIRTSWWGILGLIGWGYFVTSLVYVAIKENLIGTAIIWSVFVGLNIFSQLQMLEMLKPIKPIFGVIISGNVPSIVMAGLFFSLLLRRTKQDFRKFILIGALLGAVCIFSAFILRNWFIFSKIMGTPSWAMLCNGISILLFIALFIIIDVLGKKNWASLFKPAGQNSLTTYLAPNILYYSIWLSGIPVLFYKQSSSISVIIVGSVVWSIAMIGFANLLSVVGIRLKL